MPQIITCQGPRQAPKELAWSRSNNNFKYREGQIFCRRLKYRTGYCTYESVPLCHDLLRLSLCSLDLFNNQIWLTNHDNFYFPQKNITSLSLFSILLLSTSQKQGCRLPSDLSVFLGKCLGIHWELAWELTGGGD